MIYISDELSHYGVRGMKWGVRKQMPSSVGMYSMMEGGYSGHSIKDRMIAKLESMYDEARTDHERQVVDQWIGRLEMES